METQRRKGAEPQRAEGGGGMAEARVAYERALAIFEAFDDPRAEIVRQKLAGLDE